MLWRKIGLLGLVHSSSKTRMYGHMYGNVPYIRHHNQPVVSARNTKKSWKWCPLSCLSPENDVTFNAYHMGPSTMSPFVLIIGMTSPFMLIIAFYAYQSVEKTLYRVYSKQGLFSGFEFLLPPKQSMSPFNFTSLKSPRGSCRKSSATLLGLLGIFRKLPQYFRY